MQANLSKTKFLADGLFFKEKNAAMSHFFFCHQHKSNDCFIDLKPSRILICYCFWFTRHFFLNGPTCLEICFFCSGIFIEELGLLEMLWAWRGPTTMTSWLNLLPWRIFVERLWKLHWLLLMIALYGTVETVILASVGVFNESFICIK